MDYAQKLSVNVKAVIEEQNLSIRQLAEKIGIPASSLTDSLKSKKGLPLEVAIRVADALGYTVEELTRKSASELVHTHSKEQNEFSDFSYAEKTLISKFRLLNEEGQEKIAEYVDDLISSDKYKKFNSHGMVEEKQA